MEYKTGGRMYAEYVPYQSRDGLEWEKIKDKQDRRRLKRDAAAGWGSPGVLADRSFAGQSN